MTTYSANVNFSISELNELVKKYANQLGLDKASGVQMMMILNDTEFDNDGYNKYGLTSADITELNALIDEQADISTIDLKLQLIFTNKAKEGLDTTTMDEGTFMNAIEMYNNGSSWADILATAGLGDLDRQYDPKTGRKVPVYEDGKPVMENGVPKMKVFKTHFSTDYHYIMNSMTDEDDIRDFQIYLVKNNIVPPETFLGTESEYSEALEGAIVSVMNWLDKNYAIEEGTDLWNEIMAGDYVFFNKTQYSDYKTDENGVPVPSAEGLKKSQEMKLFNWAIQEMNKDYQKFNQYATQMEDAKLMANLKSQYKVLTPLQREDQVESWFKSVGINNPTQSQIDEWANNIALNYASVFKNLYRDMKSLQEDLGLRDWEANYLSNFGGSLTNTPFSEFADISTQLAQEDAVLQSKDQWEQEYAGQIEAYEMGEKSLKDEAAIIRMLYG